MHLTLLGHRELVLAATIVLSASFRPASAQDREVVQLTTAAARFERPFSEVGGLRELPDRRVLVLDLGEQGVVVLDERLGSARAVGRKGSGPGEYLRPTKLLTLPNGEAAILDWGNTRLLTVNSQSTPDRFLPAHAQCAGAVTQYPLYMAADQSGRFYSEGALPRRPGTAIDSTAVVRWRTNCEADTVVMFRSNPIPRGIVAYRALTQWAVSEAGTVAVLYPDPYRVTLVGPNGQRRQGPPIRYDPVRMTDALKAQWREEQQLPMGVATIDKNGVVSGGVMKKPYREPDDWPDVLPPFLGSAAMFDREGNLWVKRTVAAGQNPQYDIIDQLGNLRARVGLRAKARVVGFGQEAVYVAQRDDDDMEFLERHSSRTIK